MGQGLLSTKTRQFLEDLLNDFRARDSKSISLDEFLKYLRSTVAPRIGITRVADIGHFSGSGVSVCQVTRPRTYYNFRSGMNTGSQGKGLSAEQAEISAVMESLEAFSMEPRDFEPVLATARDLKKEHLVLEPSQLSQDDEALKDYNEELQLVWTRALILPEKVEAFVPAELIYFLFPNHYGCRAFFTTSSNGVGAHTTYNGAVMQALYELIERHYIYYLERMDVIVEAFRFDGQFLMELLSNCSEDFLDTVDIQLYSVSIDGAKEQLPFVYCVLCDEFRMSIGYGMHLDPKKAIIRAYTEAAQSWVTDISGSREDLAGTEEIFCSDEEKIADRWPERRTLKFADWTKRFTKTKGSSLENVMKWLSTRSCHRVALVDLTPAGLNCRVVKIFAQGLVTSNKYSKFVAGDMSEIPDLKRYAVYV